MLCLTIILCIIHWWWPGPTSADSWWAPLSLELPSIDWTSRRRELPWDGCSTGAPPLRLPAHVFPQSGRAGRLVPAGTWDVNAGYTTTITPIILGSRTQVLPNIDKKIFLIVICNYLKERMNCFCKCFRGNYTLMFTGVGNGCQSVDILELVSFIDTHTHLIPWSSPAQVNYLLDFTYISVTVWYLSAASAAKYKITNIE